MAPIFEKQKQKLSFGTYSPLIIIPVLYKVVPNLFGTNDQSSYENSTPDDLRWN